ncbi:MAG: tetratricopeptide repeat protein [Candidatus Omnitrophica bacterium]|nr:tetratricopeptide repeat protein [Candidatus Omnitrophota bacterium]
MYRPNMVILLVGSANRFNPWGYNSYKSQGLLSDLKDIIDDLRIVKMLKLLATNLKAKAFYWDEEHLFKEEPRSIAGYNYNSCLVYRERGFNYIKNKQQIKSAVPNDKLSTAWYYYNTGKTQQAIELLQSAIKNNPHSLENLCALAYGYEISGDLQKAEKLLQQAQQLNPHSKFVRGQMDFFYRDAQNFYQRAGKMDLALEYFRKSIELNPDDYKNYYNLNRAYDLQSKYNADFFIDFFQRLLQAHGWLKDNSVFMAYLDFFKEKKLNEDKISKWLRDDLDKLVMLCKENKADIIIQNYPVSFPMANGSLKDTAARYGLTFVDNLETFNQFTLKNETDTYLFDDSHCTAKGHEVMAANIYNVLATKKAVLQ